MQAAVLLATTLALASSTPPVVGRAALGLYLQGVADRELATPLLRTLLDQLPYTTSRYLMSSSVWENLISGWRIFIPIRRNLYQSILASKVGECLISQHFFIRSYKIFYLLVNNFLSIISF